MKGVLLQETFGSPDGFHPADGVRIFVRDQRPGIPEADPAFEFEPFCRVDRSRDRGTGSMAWD
jgi:hypothetical protein